VEELKPGDLITTVSRAGYHRVISVKNENGYSSLVVYKTVLNSSGKRSRGKAEYTCDVSYCKKITEDFLAMARDISINQAKALYDVVKSELNYF